MDLGVNVLLWLHLVSMAVGGSAVFGLPVLGAAIGRAAPEARGPMFAVARRITTIGRAALVSLIVTGIAIVWAKYGSAGELPWLFWLKMIAVAAQVALVVLAGLNAIRLAKGDTAAARRAPKFGMAGMSGFTLIVLLAVLTFS